MTATIVIERRTVAGVNQAVLEYRGMAESAGTRTAITAWFRSPFKALRAALVSLGEARP